MPTSFNNRSLYIALNTHGVFSTGDCFLLKEALYRIWCGVNRLGVSGVNRLGDTSAFVNPAGPGGVRPEWMASA